MDIKMISLNRTFKVFLLQFKRQLFTKKTIFIYVIMGLFVYSNMEPVSLFCEAVSINATPMGFVFLTNDFIFQTTFLIGLLFLISDAPFRSSFYQYSVYRSGDKEWEIGTIASIAGLTLVYTLFLVLMSMAGLRGNINFSLSWGKIWGTFARTDAALQYDLSFQVNDYLIGKYTPQFALLGTIILEWISFFWISLCVYCFNRIKKGAGILVAAIFIFLDTMIYNSWTPWAYRLSPITLAGLANYTKSRIYYGITLEYAARFYGITILLFCIIIVLFRKKKSFKQWKIVFKKNRRIVNESN